MNCSGAEKRARETEREREYVCVRKVSRVAAHSSCRAVRVAASRGGEQSCGATARDTNTPDDDGRARKQTILGHRGLPAIVGFALANDGDGDNDHGGDDDDDDGGHDRIWRLFRTRHDDAVFTSYRMRTTAREPICCYQDV